MYDTTCQIQHSEKRQMDPPFGFVEIKLRFWLMGFISANTLNPCGHKRVRLTELD